MGVKFSKPVTADLSCCNENRCRGTIKINILRFLGVYAADELPKRMPPQSLAIVKCCNRFYRGEHWLALYQDEWEDRLEIFGSYGLNPDI